ncbi:MAG: hypothetical protein WC271_11785 [Bacteroidales bacterium]
MLYKPLIAIFSALLLASTFSCNTIRSTNPETPVGAYTLFIEALKNKNTAEIWNGIDASSKILFRDALASLIRMDRIIETYFDPVEHKYMRERTGTHILKEHDITTPAQLFEFLYQPDALVIRKDEEVGAEISDDIVDANNKRIVTLVTKASGQQFVMMQESDSVWRNAGLRNVFQACLSPIAQSEAAMREYAKGNFDAEIERRREVIAYFRVQEEVIKQSAQK